MPHFILQTQRLMKKICSVAIGTIALTGCVSTPPMPAHVDNACSIFRQYPVWYKQAKKAESHWGVPVGTQLAVMRQESSFIGTAKPSRKKLLWVIPWARPSSSYGYAQALHKTWTDYQRDSGNGWAKRDNFGDSSDFISWYLRRTHLATGLPLNNVYGLYLAYHEGVQGYQHGTYKHKIWLINVAKRVQYQAQKYQKQLNYCAKTLPV
jgi:hypothetical protein